MNSKILHLFMSMRMTVIAVAANTNTIMKNTNIIMSMRSMSTIIITMNTIITTITMTIIVTVAAVTMTMMTAIAAVMTMITITTMKKYIMWSVFIPETAKSTSCRILAARTVPLKWRKKLTIFRV